MLLFCIDVNDACYQVYYVPWFWFKHAGNFGMIAAMASVYIVFSDFKPLCHKVTSVSNMYAANPG